MKKGGSVIPATWEELTGNTVEKSVDRKMNKYRVWLRSKPGCYVQDEYDVIVKARNLDDAVERAIRKLNHNKPPEVILPDSWDCMGVEIISMGNIR